MKLFEVTNRSMGESYVKVFVIADNESDAKDLVREVYKINNPNNEQAWANLDVDILCENTSERWASIVRDY